MNKISAELGRSLTLRQKCLLRDLCTYSIEVNGAPFESFELVFEALHNPRVFVGGDFSAAKDIVRRHLDGALA